MITIFLIFTYKGKVFSALYKSGIPGLFGGIILSIGFASYVFAMYETTVANANFIIQTQALFLAIFGYVFLKEKISKLTNVASTTRWKYIITSVDGDYTKKTVRDFVEQNFLARDSRALRTYINSIQPDIDLKVDLTLPDGSLQEGVSLPIGVNFFWPDADIS